jgi:hypothetical protein
MAPRFESKGKTMLATRPYIDTIAITRTFDGIEAAAHRVISQIGGMASRVSCKKPASLTCQYSKRTLSRP